MASKKGKEQTLEVGFGNVSIGDEVASIHLSVPRSQLSVSQADKCFCGKRIDGRIVSKPSDEDPDQQHFEGMEQEETLSGTFDVPSFNVKRKEIGFGLSFKIGSIDIATLARFAKRNGLLLVDSLEALPEKQRGRPKKAETNGDGEDD